MPKIKNAALLPAFEGVRQLQRERLPAMTGVKLRRLARQLMEAIQDVDAERVERLKRYAVLTEAGELETDAAGQARFPAVEDEIAFRAEIAELYEGETEVAEEITLADLVRKERDAAGKVYEVDDVPGEVIERLGELLVEPG